MCAPIRCQVLSRIPSAQWFTRTGEKWQPVPLRALVLPALQYTLRPLLPKRRILLFDSVRLPTDRISRRHIDKARSRKQRLE
jgi:hypothetical protein